MATFALLLLCTTLPVSRSFKIYTDINGGDWCMATGRRCWGVCWDGGDKCYGGFSDHSLSSSGDEENLVWIEGYNSDLCASWYWEGSKICNVYGCIEWDADKGAGHEIQSNERNAKMDDGGGDTLSFSNNKLCDTVSGQTCCLEWDNNVYDDYLIVWPGRDQDCHISGREAKWDCSGGADYIYFGESPVAGLPDQEHWTQQWHIMAVLVAAVLCNLVYCVYSVRSLCATGDSKKVHSYGMVQTIHSNDENSDLKVSFKKP